MAGQPMIGQSATGQSTTGRNPGSTAPAAGEIAGPLVVVVVGDSRARTRAMRGLLSAPGFVVAAEATTATEAEAAVVLHQPGAVLLDLDPAAGGIEAIERIMGTRPTPVVVCGALAAHSAAALAAGAVDVIGALDALPTSPQYVTALRRHLRVASRVRVITHPRNRLRERGLGAMTPRATDIRSDSALTAAADRLAGSRVPVARSAASQVRVVAIGASTGGPPALATILADLPADLPVPLLVVQHMADGFVESLATWLDGLSPLPVVLAENGRAMRPGVVYVAPAGVNTLLRPGLRIELRTPPPGQFHVPGVDAAFASTATVCGPHAVGVLLTGMGRDGATGLRSMADSGALTLGQDEPSSVVWGMPAAAQALGAVAEELPLGAMAARIVAAVFREAPLDGPDRP
jgi:two-component system, chemotaxis family, protein-glutamate methylesterase/glutaminase